MTKFNNNLNKMAKYFFLMRFNQNIKKNEKQKYKGETQDLFTCCPLS